jgi:predicted helicase
MAYTPVMRTATELYRLGFGEAVEKNLLTDYRVLVGWRSMSST